MFTLGHPGGRRAEAVSLLGSLALAMSLMAAGGPTIAADADCWVRNRDTHTVYDDFQDAAAAASAGDRLALRGTCLGSTEIDKDLRVVGSATEGSGPPTLGGTMWVGPGASVTLQDLTIQGGYSRIGGGIADAGALTLRNVVVRGNMAYRPIGGGGDGGGVFVAAGALLVLQGSTSISDNLAAGHGGGVFLRPGATLVMKGSSSISRNTAFDSGGGVESAGSSVLVGVRCAPDAADANVYDNDPDDCHASP